MQIIESYLFQILFSVGLIVICGLVIALCNKAFCRLTGKLARPLLLTTGFIGTPVHELGHAAMCLLFGHRITAIKLYQLDDESGTLGYVTHSYNKKNIYHQIGNFFIGVAPIILGSGLLILLMLLLVPTVFSGVRDSLLYLFLIDMDFFSLSTYASLGSIFWDIIVEIFDFSNLSNLLWWVFILLAVAISLHMTLSTADIKGGAIGFAFIAVILLIVDIVVFFISSAALESMTQGIVAASFYIVGFLAISIVMSAVILAIALAIKGICKIARR